MCQVHEVKYLLEKGANIELILQIMQHYPTLKSFRWSVDIRVCDVYTGRVVNIPLFSTSFYCKVNATGNRCVS